jgi:DHA1 family tetracycline resistance protein-like MFS transporter
VTDPAIATKPSKPAGRISPALLPIFLIVLVDIFGFTLVIPLLSIYAESSRFHATPQQATLLVSTYAVCQLLAGPPLGRLSDRIGRKPVLIISQLGTLAGFLIMARADSLWMLFLARAVDGLTAGNLTVAQAYIADNTRPEDRAKSFALIGIAFGLGFFLGPAVTGRLSVMSLTAPIYLAAAMSFTSILCTTFLLPGGKPSGVGHDLATAGAQADAPEAPGGKRVSILNWGVYRTFVSRPLLRMLFLQFFCFAFTFSSFIAGFALFAERTFTWHGHPFGPREVGYLFGFNGFLGIVLQGGLIGRLVKRFGEAGLTRAGFVAVFLAQLLLGFIHSVPPLLVVSFLSSFGNGVLRPCITSLITRNVGRGEQGVVLGLNQSINSIAQITAPVLAGFLITQGLLPAWAWVGAFVSLVGFALNRAAASEGQGGVPVEKSVSA